MKNVLQKFFGDDPQSSEYYGKIINERQFDRLIKYFTDGKVVHGGKTDKNKLYIEPTLMTDVSVDNAIMRDEIFGPILPIISFDTMDEALSIIAKNKNPLAFYIFTSTKEKEKPA